MNSEQYRYVTIVLVTLIHGFFGKLQYAQLYSKC